MKKLLLACFVLLNFLPLLADDGMWIPLLLEKTRYQRMVELGCKMSAEDIYSVNHSSLKDAVLLFDRGCSGVVVSNSGLVFTNHHCGYGAIQSHSTLEHDYLTNGFMANTSAEELPNPQLTVSFLVRMDDVTEKILNGVTNTMNEADRRSKVQKNTDKLIGELSKGSTDKFVVKPLYNDNQYFVYEYEVFTDVRLVAAPPSNIGKFGGDTDNWVWPRHTGDFSVFRIYADKNNKPAPYSPDNVPYQPKKYVPVSIKGVSENDFTMVYGYPAATDQYLNSREVELMVNLQLPQKVALRTVRLNIMQEEMNANALTRIQYAAKYAGTSNAWKKWEGMVKGLTATNAIQVKQEMERKFIAWASLDETRKTRYGNLLNDYNKQYDVYDKFAIVADYYTEAVMANEIIAQASRLYGFLNKNKSLPDSALQAELRKYVKSLDGFYKNYTPEVDQRTFVRLMEMYKAKISPEFYPDIFSVVARKYKNDFNSWGKDLFAKSVLVSQSKFYDFLNKWNKKSLTRLTSDPALLAYESFFRVITSRVTEPYSKAVIQIDSLNRIYMQGLLEYNQDKILFPDANQTLRVSYGKAEGYAPTDGVRYGYYTTIDGIFEKQDSSIRDYAISPKLLALWKAKDYGPYADANGQLRVCFAASNHTSGGNSGSPVFNASGELVGLNFDRCWEGTMSDIYYDSAFCRNIVLDSRYLLFVLDKVQGGSRLLQELQITK